MMVKKFKIKSSVYVLAQDDYTYQVIQTATRKIDTFKVDDLTKKILEELTEEKSEEELSSNLSTFRSEDVSSCLLALQDFGIVRSYDLSTINSRYIKQILFLDELTSSWDETLNLQKKIENSKVAIFGVGGIGTWMCNSLYQMGVGELRISDPDFVTESNLNRQLFFSSKDIGKRKVDVVRQKLPDALIKTYYATLSSNQDLDEIVSDVDFIVNCADKPSVAETSRIINVYATKYQIPYMVTGGYNMHLGMIGPIIVPGKTASFDDFLEYQKKNDFLSKMKKVKDIEDTGSLGPIAGAVANIQAMEIFKYITGKGDLNINRFAEIDFLNLNVEWRNFA